MIIDMEKIRLRQKETDNRTIAKQKDENIMKIKTSGAIIKMQESEKLKTERKELSPAIIKLNNDKEIEDLFIKDITTKFLSGDKICDVSFDNIFEHRETVYNNIIYNDFDDLEDEDDNKKEHQKRIFIDMFKEHESHNDIINYILRKSYKDPEYPDTWCLFYSKQLDRLYGVFVDKYDNKELRQIDYEKDLSDEIINTITLYFTKINYYCKALNPNINNNMQKLNNCVLSLRIIKNNSQLKSFINDIFEHTVT